MRVIRVGIPRGRTSLMLTKITLYFTRVVFFSRHPINRSCRTSKTGEKSLSKGDGHLNLKDLKGGESRD